MALLLNYPGVVVNDGLRSYCEAPAEDRRAKSKSASGVIVNRRAEPLIISIDGKSVPRR